MANAEHVLSILADPTRRALVEELGRGPMTVGQLWAKVAATRSAVSQHLQLLRAAALVLERRALTRSVLAGLMAIVARANAAPASEPYALGPAWESAWNGKQAAAAAALFAPDAVFFHASGDQVVGRPAIKALFAATLAVNTPHIAMSPLVQAQAGHHAWVSGSYTETVKSSNDISVHRVQGSYLLLLSRSVGSGWQIERMMWSD